jgi:formylglycine-generating enzyme required for sulfatase activity
MAFRLEAKIIFIVRILGFMLFTSCLVQASAVAGDENLPYKPGRIFRDCPECPEMVVVPPGKFLMGLSDEEADRDRKQQSLLFRILLGRKSEVQPQHSVDISYTFAISKFLTTRADFEIFVNETGFVSKDPCVIRVGSRYIASDTADWRQPGFDQSSRDPVICVSWSDANAYIAWLNKKSQSAGKEGQTALYRLPTEAEWEYAARAGTTTTRYWGNAIGKDLAVCAHCGSPWDNQQPAPVGLYGHNQFGLYDMLGNVWEWTEDCWNSNYAGAPTDGSAWLEGNCSQRVMRGGSWLSDPEASSSTNRSKDNAEQGSTSTGFRVARTLIYTKRE